MISAPDFEQYEQPTMEITLPGLASANCQRWLIPSYKLVDAELLHAALRTLSQDHPDIAAVLFTREGSVSDPGDAMVRVVWRHKIAEPIHLVSDPLSAQIKDAANCSIDAAMKAADHVRRELEDYEKRENDAWEKRFQRVQSLIPQP